MSSTKKINTSITAQELEALIKSAPKGATLEFKAGNYEFDDAITISRSDISLVGAGAGKTRLTFTDKALDNNDNYAIRLDGSEKKTVGKLVSSVDEGDHRIKLDKRPDLEIGDTVRIWQDNDSSFFKDIGDTSWKKIKYAELRTSMAKVESIDGKTITLDRGVHFDFDSGKTQIERIATVDDVSLKGFSVEFDLGTPDDAAFKNTQGDLTGYHAVELNGTTNASIEDVAVTKGPSTAFRFSKTLDADVDGIEAHGAFNKGSGGNGYAYELHESYDGTFQNLEDSGMRHSLLFASWRSSVGNEAHIKSTDRDINFHGGRDHDNTVHVEQSIRNADNDKMSTTLWINSGGESFGAITDADANEVMFDYVVGSRRDDQLQGTDDGVYLDGGLGSDTLIGGKGDDVLQGGPGDVFLDGDDRIDGGSGNDTALYMQDYDDSDVTFDDGEVIIRNKGGKDILTDVEQIVFGDGTILDVDSRKLSHGDDAKVPSASSIIEDQAISLSRDTSADTDLEVSGNITSRWSSGYVAEIFVKNTSDETISDLEIHFDLSDDIDTLWNGETGSDKGWIRDDSDTALESGATWRFAYKAYGDEKQLPSDISAEGSGNDSLEVQLLGMGAAIPDALAG